MATLAAGVVPTARFAELLETAKPFLPIPILAGLAPIMWLFFRDTWRELDEDAHRHRAELLAECKTDYRPFVAMRLCAPFLTRPAYYCGCPGVSVYS